MVDYFVDVWVKCVQKKCLPRRLEVFIQSFRLQFPKLKYKFKFTGHLKVSISRNVFWHHPFETHCVL